MNEFTYPYFACYYAVILMKKNMSMSQELARVPGVKLHKLCFSSELTDSNACPVPD